MDKTEWPTAQKLESLRGDGLVPISKTSLRLVASAALIVYFSTQHAEIASLLKDISNPNLDLEGLADKSKQLGFFIVIPAIISFLAMLVVGMLQTKFLFRPSLCAPNASRFSGKIISKEKFVSAFMSIVLFLLIALVSMLCFWKFASQYLSLLNMHDTDIIKHVDFWSGTAVIVVPVVLVLIAFFSWILATISFMFRYRMSRMEVLREGS